MTSADLAQPAVLPADEPAPLAVGLFDLVDPVGLAGVHDLFADLEAGARLDHHLGPHGGIGLGADLDDGPEAAGTGVRP